MMKEFKKGQMVIYAKKDVNENIYEFELGIFKNYNEDKTMGFVYYLLGECAILTDIKDLYYIKNGYTFNSRENLFKFELFERKNK